jgi:hypothetical protein
MWDAKISVLPLSGAKTRWPPRNASSPHAADADVAVAIRGAGPKPSHCLPDREHGRRTVLGVTAVKLSKRRLPSATDKLVPTQNAHVERRLGRRNNRPGSTRGQQLLPVRRTIHSKWRPCESSVPRRLVPNVLASKRAPISPAGQFSRDPPFLSDVSGGAVAAHLSEPSDLLPPFREVK